MGAAARPLSERVVLVVDDEEAVCHLTARMLAHAGFRVLEAHGGTEAVALLSTLNGTVQLVVSDISMPRMTGMELAALMAGQYPQTRCCSCRARAGQTPATPGHSSRNRSPPRPC
jgi:CheY-like chemotaxis protein